MDLRLQVKQNRAVLAYLLARKELSMGSLAKEGHYNNRAEASLPHALADLLPNQAAAVASEVENTTAGATAPSQCTPAQVNLSSVLLAHGFALAALKLAAPLVEAAHSVPHGVAVRAFVNTVEALLLLGAPQVRLSEATEHEAAAPPKPFPVLSFSSPPRCLTNRLVSCRRRQTR